MLTLVLVMVRVIHGHDYVVVTFHSLSQSARVEMELIEIPNNWLPVKENGPPVVQLQLCRWMLKKCLASV